VVCGRVREGFTAEVRAYLKFSYCTGGRSDAFDSYFRLGVTLCCVFELSLRFESANQTIWRFISSFSRRSKSVGFTPLA
jgi:hypothetical protein